MRRTLYGKVNINSAVVQEKVIQYKDEIKNMTVGEVLMTKATVYGSGYGADSWAGYTEVNLNNHADVYEVYGGGEAGKVVNLSTSKKRANQEYNSELVISGSYKEDGLDNDLAIARHDGKKYNANVIINKGALVRNYAYGGGKGDSAIPKSGDVNGTSYIALLGGTVGKDIYAAGTVGAVLSEYKGLKDDFGEDFVASATAYIEGGTARNVYGGGWEGSVGYHKPVDLGDGKQDVIGGPITDDILGETHVIIGTLNGDSYINGLPAIQRNVYGGGEGGPVYGTTHVTINNGYIGYEFKSDLVDNPYVEKVDDETASDGVGKDFLYDSGCVFGGGYIDNSSVDFTYVTMYGGMVRNALFGGGEIAAVGRGDVVETGESNENRRLTNIYKGGKTHVYLYDGHVLRNVFGGGRGYDNLSRRGSLRTDGYVIGQTEVNIYGGEIGTDEGMTLGYGNVFGGGDVGYVYSAYDGGMGQKSGNRYDDNEEGYYYKFTGTYTNGRYSGSFDETNGEKILTEDCKVLIEPRCKAKEAVLDCEAGEYVPIEKLNTLKSKSADARWTKLDDKGIIIHNAVFGGGNVTSGSDQVYANAITVYGNATASIHDVYHRDLITIGTGHTGGLYGDGNLTFVDGYRGLNITNYGTDYYNIAKEITLQQYEALPDREAAYYELKYSCLQECTDNQQKTYRPANAQTGTKASTITADELRVLFDGIKTADDKPMVDASGEPDPRYWKAEGVCSRYAGRIMNTIQRADFCGVFGSRMVMQGAQDRVPEIVDHTNYTINRVREVSLNKKQSTAGDNSSHGNYFGIYNIVNYLGALTSDVDFHDIRTTDTNDETLKADGTTRFDEWKETHKNDRKRNNGTSHNEVALASGVYLELTTEKSTGTSTDEKDWGYITGVIELDLINVQTGIGGGFVYAKNVHGVRTATNYTQTTLTALNQGAVTRRKYTYSDIDSNKKEWQTSGNFVHNTQTIIDDCYPESNRYSGTSAVKAHYWYIKGNVYVYDQYISAYTGTPVAYSEVVNIPLTIAAASHGTMKLLNVQPNRYAYYSYYKNSSENTKLKSEAEGQSEDEELEIKEKKYKLNDPISYWDYYMLSAAERNLFVEKTYVTVDTCTLGNKTYNAGYVLLPNEYNTLLASAPKKELVQGEAAVASVYSKTKKTDVAFTDVFRLSNNLSHDTGFILTYEVNNPAVWDKYYTHSTTGEKITVEEWKAKSTTEKESYHNGPTYHPTENGLYGQREYSVRDIISKTDYDTYQRAKTNYPDAVPAGQAVFEKAYCVTTYMEPSDDDHLYPGTAIVKSKYTDKWDEIEDNVDDAYVATSTIKLEENNYIYLNSVISETQMNKYKSDFPDLASEITDKLEPAYYCTKKGLYGGDYYVTTMNYRGLAAWSSLSEADRKKFQFNYDALDVLIDPTYSKAEGYKYQYDGFQTAPTESNLNMYLYSTEKPVDYTATYNGTDNEAMSDGLTYTDATGTHYVKHNQELTREQYESLLNEKRYYTPIHVTGDDGNYKHYIVKTPFIHGETPYAVGISISKETYDDLGDDQSNIEIVEFSSSDKGKTFYYCRESYKITADGHPVKAAIANGGVEIGTTIEIGGIVPLGFITNEADGAEAKSYTQLVNKQSNFIIHGTAPTETSTLYVSSSSDIFDLQTEKIITVIYEYNYEESDESGSNITPVSERHVLNIHLTFESGVPFIEDISKPNIVLPKTVIDLKQPVVTPGAYVVTGGGWELFEKREDSESHTNGIEFTPGSDPLYWYQNNYYLAYYAKTYLGKTYSNAVQVSVANYHDLSEVMADKEHHMYVDHSGMERDAKIYLDQTKHTGENQLSLLNNFYMLSIGDVVTGHSPLNTRQVGGLKHLEFILRSDLSAPDNWTSLGSSTHCFEGMLHGDGHTIGGLNTSLFNSLCGEVYNLGVTGSFTTSGIANDGSGYLENCWVKSTQPAGANTNALLGSSTRNVPIVNCYYPEGSNFKNQAGTIAKPLKSFNNGEVAYDLNEFYLFKRYCDSKNNLSSNEYNYWKLKEDGSGTYEKLTGHYENQEGPYMTGSEGSYVENRYSDGDFRYASGTLPTKEDTRCWQSVNTEGKTIEHFSPIWPDDYLFFGQTLTYNAEGYPAHQSEPAVVNSANRVYRAPAYYGNNTMGVAYFNPNAVLAKAMSGEDEESMTAIDFSGANGDVSGGYSYRGDSKFYPPLLDDNGLTGLMNLDLTKNLLVYTKTGNTAANKTSVTVGGNESVDGYLLEHAYKETAPYKTVSAQDLSSHQYHGLWVNDGKATTDHFLVDKEVFNAPISYTFAEGKRMWYQRTPERFVTMEGGTSKGWLDISLPFKVDMVTTQTKGELTHFYQGSTTGHEYWLRELTNIKNDNPDDLGIFQYPQPANNTKVYNNTFLYDHYYSYNEFDDKNRDDYQKQYYASEHTFNNYPLQQAGKPYLIGFPSDYYYEFDLSGEWTPSNSYDTPANPGKQTITFASKPGITIAVSDTELKKEAYNGYLYCANYKTTSVPALGYLLNSDGSKYTSLTEETEVRPFRPYFVKSPTSGARGEFDSGANNILINEELSRMGVLDHQDLSLDENLIITAGKKKICVESQLHYTTDVRIVTTAGVTLTSYSIQPSEFVETQVYNAGVYIVYADGGKYVKKVIVR